MPRPDLIWLNPAQVSGGYKGPPAPYSGFQLEDCSWQHKSSEFCVLFGSSILGQYVNKGAVWYGWCWRTRPWSPHGHAWEDRDDGLWMHCSLPSATCGSSLGQWSDGSTTTAARPPPLPILTGRQHLTRQTCLCGHCLRKAEVKSWIVPVETA